MLSQQVAPRPRPEPDIQALGLNEARVRETFRKKRMALDALAKRLIEKEVVDRTALVQLIAETESLARTGADQRHA